MPLCQPPGAGKPHHPIFFFPRCYIRSMSIRSAYRGMPTYLAVPLAVIGSAAGSVALAALGVAIVDFFVQSFHIADGPGAGVLVVLVALNIAVSAFIGLVSALVNAHHPTSWGTPTLALMFCAALLWVKEPFDLEFVPFALGTGLTAWGISCWFLRRKGNLSSGHGIEA